MPIDFFFWALCFLFARNDIDSKYKELCNCCADLIRIQGITLGLLPVSPTTGYQRNRLNEGVKNVTDSDVKPSFKRGHYAVEVDLPPVMETPEVFPGTESTIRCLQNIIFVYRITAVDDMLSWARLLISRYKRN